MWASAKNRLHSILHRHNLHLPTGEPFSQANQAWWQALTVSRTERLRVRHDLLRIQHLTTLIDEVEVEIAQLSVQEPWYGQLAFVIQIPGIGLLSGMTVLSAIGDITRFPSPRQLAGYKWASRQRTATALGMSRLDFVWQQLDRLGLGQQLDCFHYSRKLYVRQPTTPPVVREAARIA